MSEGWFACRVPIRFADVDQMGHVNHVSFVRYLEEGRLAWWRELVSRHALPVASWILAEVHAAFRAQGSYPGTVVVRTRTAAFLPKGWILEQEVSTEDGLTLVEGWSRQVTFDYATGRSAPLPDAIRDAIVAFEGRHPPLLERWPAPPPPSRS